MADFQGDALALSYWLTRSLPLEAAWRQALLAEPTAAARLRRVVALLEQRAPLRCVTCAAQIAKQADVVEVSDEGAGGIYVNSHGKTHAACTAGRIVFFCCLTRAPAASTSTATAGPMPPARRGALFSSVV